MKKLLLFDIPTISNPALFSRRASITQHPQTRHIRTPVILAALFLCACSALGTVAVLDQSIVPVYPHLISAPIESIHTRAQTFTIGVSGTLVQFDVDIINSAPSFSLPVLWDIRPTVAGVPVQSDTSTLASGSFLNVYAPSDWSFYSITLGAGAFQVSQGDVLALVFRSPYDGAAISWQGDTTNPYNRGAAYDGTPGANSTTWSPFVGDDFSLKTYVAPIPEPSLGCLCLVAGISAALRQRPTGTTRAV